MSDTTTNSSTTPKDAATKDTTQDAKPKDDSADRLAKASAEAKRYRIQARDAQNAQAKAERELADLKADNVRYMRQIVSSAIKDANEKLFKYSRVDPKELESITSDLDTWLRLTWPDGHGKLPADNGTYPTDAAGFLDENGEPNGKLIYWFLQEIMRQHPGMVCKPSLNAQRSTGLAYAMSDHTPAKTPSSAIPQALNHLAGRDVYLP